MSGNAPLMRTDADDPARVAKLATDNLLSRGQYMRYDVGDVHALHYAEACTAFGAARIAGLLGDAATLERLADRYSAARLPLNTANHVDANVCGIVPLELSIHLKDGSLRDEGLAYADGQWADTPNRELSPQTRFWIDDVWMIGALQTTAFRATGKNGYLERCALELDAYRARLQRPSGLFFHGPAAPHYWGRGNGWVAAGFAEILSLLPAGNPHRPSLLEGFRSMSAALVRYQADDGMWRQLVDHPTAWKETSCTAMFGYALALGARCGALDAADCCQAISRAWNALSARVDGDGLLADVCAGTGQTDDVDFYLGRPRVTGDLHGQAALLWFALEMMLSNH